MKKLEDGKIYKFIENFCKENGLEFKDRYSICYQNSIPMDSVDRFVALYMLENQKDIIQNFKTVETMEEAATWYKSLDKNFTEEFELVGYWAYDNYEREGMSNVEALYNLVHVAKDGKEIVLTDSYDNDGYFGAS